MIQWKQVQNFDGYIASSDGQIAKVKKQSRDTYQYPIVTMTQDGKQKTKTVHRIIWEAFNGPLPKGMTINHKDGNKTNNRLDNLEIMTIGDNIRHAIKVLGQDRRGVGNPASRLTVEQVVEIRILRANKTPIKDLAKKFKLSAAMIGRITSGKSWANAPGPITKPKLGCKGM